MRWSVVVVAAVGLARTARADDDIAVPLWTISLGGGFGATYGYDDIAMANQLGIGGLLGGALDLRRVGGAIGYYAEGDLYPIGGSYGGRVGVIIGRHYSHRFSELVDSKQISSTEVENTFRLSPDTVAGVWGLDASVAYHDNAGDNAVTLEAGIGFMAQLLFEAQLVYDVAHDAPGMRVRMYWAQGTTVSYGFGISVESLFNLEASTMPSVVLFTVGIGQGFDAR
jgi:hypothetical protein